MKENIWMILLLICFAVNAQEKAKDTLFFKFDKSYILNSKAGTGNFFIKDSNSDGTFFFQRKETLKNLKAKNKLCLKKYVRKSKYYNKSANRKLYDYGLYEHLRNYVIFLVKRKEFIKVKASFVIE